MSQYLVFYEIGIDGKIDLETIFADDDPQLLHKLGDSGKLKKVTTIYQVRPLYYDIAYYQDIE